MGNFFSVHRTTIFIIIGVTLALGALWWSLSESPEPESLVTGQSPSAAPGSQEIVTTLLQLRTVSLSGAIFSDPSFGSLRDFGTQIIPEPIGRPNPFAPLSWRPFSPTSTAPISLPRTPLSR